jgi:hypothetical protein
MPSGARRLGESGQNERKNERKTRGKREENERKTRGKREERKGGNHG